MDTIAQWRLEAASRWFGCDKRNRRWCQRGARAASKFGTRHASAAAPFGNGMSERGRHHHHIHNPTCSAALHHAISRLQVHLAFLDLLQRYLATENAEMAGRQPDANHVT